jgi:hypothetical protein
VGLRWQRFGESWRGWDDLGRLAAALVRYDHVKDDDPRVIVGHYFAAFVVQDRVPGEYATPEEAQAAAEAAHDAIPG